MDRKAKNTMIISVIALALVLIGVTYAYFSARITGLESASTIRLTAGRMGIQYSEGDENVIASNIYPREESWATKTFTLTGWNTTDQRMYYEIGLNVTTNTFSDEYLTYDLTLLSGTNGTPVASQTGVSINGTGKISFGMGTFLAADGDAHNYELKIYFKDNGLDQNDAQGAVFNAKIYVEESNGIPAPSRWKNAPAGSLLAGIKANQAKPNLDTDTGMTVPGREVTAQSGDYMSEGLRSTEDDYGISYYYRGAVDNNYLVFANMCWRIVRIDGLGNIKLVLYNRNPSSASNPCDSALFTTTNAFAANQQEELYNIVDSYDKNAYVGFMRGNPGSSSYDEEHQNLTSNKSLVLTMLEEWYENKLQSYDSKLADVIWCNDKSLASITSIGNRTEYTNLGYGNAKTIYGASERLISSNEWAPNPNATPTLKCPDASGTDINISRFTVSNNNYGGNGKLTYKIGLLTADEIAFAGGAYEVDNSTYYLYLSGQYWMTMTPSNYFSNIAVLFGVTTSGKLGGALNDENNIGRSYYTYYSAYPANKVRPAISLKSTVSITGGNGTQSNPFVVD